MKVKKNDSTITSFAYDGDGKRVKAVQGGATTYFVGGYYELSGGSVTKYYFAEALRVAMRQGSELYYLFADHLGSSTATYQNSNGAVSQQRYLPWGGTRPSAANLLATDYTFTGQYSNVDDFGLLFYNARWYDPYLNRWTQPDNIIPNPYISDDWDRYSFVRNNPLKYIDPTGNCVEKAEDYEDCMDWAKKIEKDYSFVNVIVCIGNDVVAGCKGWTAEEMELLYQSLSEYPLEDFIDGENFDVVRRLGDKYAGLWDLSKNQLSIYDAAWTTPPSLGILETFSILRDSDNLKGTIAHELTHVAQSFHPELEDKYRDAMEQLSPMEKWLSKIYVGLYYNWGVYDDYKDQPDLYDRLIQNEYMAMIVATTVYWGK